MRFPLVAALILCAGAAGAQTGGADATAPSVRGAGTAAQPSQPLRPRQPTPARTAPTGASDPTVEQEAKKAREAAERRLRERERNLSRTLKSICLGC